MSHATDSELRQREYLTEREVDKLMKASRDGCTETFASHYSRSRAKGNPI